MIADHTLQSQLLMVLGSRLLLMPQDTAQIRPRDCTTETINSTTTRLTPEAVDVDGTSAAAAAHEDFWSRVGKSADDGEV
jgi:hypothetical protein